jgi:hypothetical protein
MERRKRTDGKGGALRRRAWQVLAVAALLAAMACQAPSALLRIEAGEDERRACGCHPAAAAKPCPPECARHAWWWNIGG